MFRSPRSASDRVAGTVLDHQAGMGVALPFLFGCDVRGGDGKPFPYCGLAHRSVMPAWLEPTAPLPPKLFSLDQPLLDLPR